MPDMGILEKVLRSGSTWAERHAAEMLEGKGHLKDLCPAADDGALHQAVFVVTGEEDHQQAVGLQESSSYEPSLNEAISPDVPVK